MLLKADNYCDQHYKLVSLFV